MEVAAGRQPGLLEQGLQALARRPGVGGRLEDHEFALVQDGRQRPPGVRDVGEVGLALVGERGGDADQHGVAAGEHLVVGAGPEAVAERLQALVVDVLDLTAAGVEPLDHPLGDVEPHDLVPRLGKRHGERQPDVPQANDPNPHAGSV